MDSEKDPNNLGGSWTGKTPADETQGSTSAPAEAGGAESAASSSDETADERRARLMAEVKAKAAARMAAKGGAPAKPETPAATPAAPPVTTPAANADAPSGETPEEKRARIIAEAKAKAAAKMAAKGSPTAGSEAATTTPTAATTTPAATTTVDVPDAPGRDVPSGTPPATRVAPGAAKATPTASVAQGVPAAVAARQHPTTVDTIPEPPINKMRRRIIWASIIGFVGTSLLMFFRFFLPRTIFEPSSIFRVGFPGDYGVGVDTKYQQLYRIWVVKTSDRLFVINAVCTHLGCTPDWKASENKFKCPCHGSGYDSEGINFEGPAPRPMDRAHIELDAEGQIVVNKGRLYDWPKGGENRFEEPGAYIPMGG